MIKELKIIYSSWSNRPVSLLKKIVKKTLIFISYLCILTTYIFSDGVGRSGTYVLIDMVLNRLSKGCKEIDIAATLEHIRYVHIISQKYYNFLIFSREIS